MKKNAEFHFHRSNFTQLSAAAVCVYDQRKPERLTTKQHSLVRDSKNMDVIDLLPEAEQAKWMAWYMSEREKSTTEEEWNVAGTSIDMNLFATDTLMLELMEQEEISRINAESAHVPKKIDAKAYLGSNEKGLQCRKCKKFTVKYQLKAIRKVLLFLIVFSIEVLISVLNRFVFCCCFASRVMRGWCVSPNAVRAIISGESNFIIQIKILPIVVSSIPNQNCNFPSQVRQKVHC